MTVPEVVQLLARMFPSFQGIPPEEATRRAESLGMFAARVWSAGAQAMQARGINVPPQAHAQLAATAAQVAQAGQGGVGFLTHVRQAMNNDAHYAPLLAGLAKVFAESLQRTPNPAPVQPAPVQPAPASAPLDLAPPQPTAPRSMGVLDLAPEQPTAPRSMGAMDLAPQPAPSPGGLGLAPVAEPAQAQPQLTVEELLYDQPGGSEAEALQDDGNAPTDPAERAFWSYERTGDTSFLDQADQILRGELQQAPHALAAAMAEANLGKVAVLRGQGEEAQRLARSSLAKHPTNPYGVEVLVRVSRGEAKQAAFSRLLLQLKFALERRDPNRIKPLADAMRQQYPNEPFSFLALMLVGRLQSDDAEFELNLQLAWERFPSQLHAHRSFGGMVDADICDLLNTYGHRPYKRMEEEGLRKTVEDIDDKQNVQAGSMRMSVGLAKVALCQPGVLRPVQRRLHYAVGRGLMGLQYFEAAQVEMGKLLMLAALPEEHKLVQKDRLQCQALWRAFDKPGIKAQQKRYNCLGAHGMAETIRKRLEAIRADRQQREEEVYSQGATLWERAQKDEGIQREIEAASNAQTTANPITPLIEIEKELQAIAAERSAPAPAKKGGLFGKIKAAASSVGSAAKKFREGQLTSKKNDATRRLAVVLARDLNDYEYTHPLLIGFSRRAAMLEAFLDYFQAEEGRCKEDLNALAFGSQ